MFYPKTAACFNGQDDEPGTLCRTQLNTYSRAFMNKQLNLNSDTQALTTDPQALSKRQPVIDQEPTS